MHIALGGAAPHNFHRIALIGLGDLDSFQKCYLLTLILIGCSLYFSDKV